MANRGSTARVRAPLQARSRRRWLLVGGVAGLWLVFLMGSGSLVASTILMLLLGAVAGGVVVVLRLFGFGRDHPWFHHAASRPWRDGRDVLRVALRHLPEVFLVTPQGSLLAPNAVEIRMNPDDIESLADLIDLNLVNASAAEAYAAEVAAHSARVVSNVPLEVGVVADVAVPPGRYRLRQRSSLAAMTLAADPVTSVGLTGADPACGAYPVSMPVPAGPLAPPGPAAAPDPAGGACPVSAGVGPFRDGQTRSERAMTPAGMTGAATVATGAATLAEPALPPMLRLITNGAVAETRVSGVRAGRGKAVELPLPEDPTVSRLHATFTCSGGEWRITVLGRNGVQLNGTPLTSEHVVRDGDSIRWGQQSSAPVSAVVIR
jgi:FHA domain